MTDTKTTGVRAFGLVWLGQLVASVGSGLTTFALGIWVFRKTGAVTNYAAVAFFGILPGLLISPLAGVYVDRWDRRRILLGSNLASGLRTLAVAALLWQGDLRNWHVYAAAALASVIRAFHVPAYMAATTLLVPRKHLARASGMLQLGQAAAETLAPFLAGLLVSLIRVEGVLFIDILTSLFAMVSLALVAVPRPAQSAAGRIGKGSAAREATFGWQFIRERPGLRGLLLYFAMVNLVFSMASVLAVPLVLSFADETLLGRVLAAGSAGLLAGSIVMSVTGGPRPHIHGVLGFGLLLGVALVLVGLRPDPRLVAAGLFLTLFGVPVVNGSSQAIWQVKVPPDVQGRVFAVRRALALFTVPLGHLLAGPLADRVFRPLLLPRGALAASLGPVVGVGPGRGIGLLYITLAALPILTSLWGYTRPRLRRVEEELPDALVD
ncbi:MAG TPA: MFS transporter [Thermoanaerobaculia bacterium]|nr:MFS transporter [Thermoanaerobaculia bacterium]